MTVQPSTLIPLASAAKIFPLRRNGKRISISTLWRWSKTGIRGVVLETYPVGAQLYTTAEACHRFLEKLIRTKRAPAHVLPRASRRKQKLAQAERGLKAMGF